MDRLDIVFKSFIGVVGFIISSMVDGLGIVFTILVGIQLADIITGVMAGYANKNLRSAVGVIGIIKKVYVLILIGVVYMLQHVTPIAEFAGDGITIAFIIAEFISIVENGGKMGVYIPAKVKDAIEILKGKGEGK
jgi:toxin secretion/phage lysis holin